MVLGKTLLANLRGLRGFPGEPGADGLPGVNAIENDAAVAGYISTAGTSATKDALAQAVGGLAAPGGVLRPFRTVVQGDSLTESGDSKLSRQFRGSWFTCLHAASKGQVRLTQNGGRGGFSSAQLQAAFDADVLAFDPTMVILMPGRNDGQALGYPAEMIAYVTEAVKKCRARNIGVVLVNTVPQGQAALAAPTGVTATLLSSANGTWPAGTHRFKVKAAVASANTVGSIIGETELSTSIGVVTTTNATSIIKLAWDHVPGANVYRIYRENGDGSGVYRYIQDVLPSNSPVYQIGHSAVLTAQPAVGGTSDEINTTELPVSQVANRTRINAWLYQYASREGIPLVDVYSALAESATGRWTKGLTYDGTHPNGEANKIIGETIWATIQPLVKPSPPPIAAAAVDTLNLASDGFLLATATSIPAGYGKATYPTQDAANHVTQVLASRAGFRGRVLEQKFTASGFGDLTGPTITTGFSPGDLLLMAARIEMDAAEGGGFVQLSLRDNANVDFALWKAIASDFEPTTVSVEGVVPAGATSIRFYHLAQSKVTAWYGQLTVYNLTTNEWLEF